MAPENPEARNRRAWSLVRAQHGAVARRQLLALGFTHDAIKHRLQTGRLRRLTQGVYALGRLDLTPKGRWMAAVLACGENACLSHRSAGALYGVCEEQNGVIEVSVRGTAEPRREGLKVRTRPSLPSQDIGVVGQIPITSPVRTMVDLSTELPDWLLARAVNEADKLVAALLDKDTFVLTQEELERLFLPITREVGLPLPLTGEWVNGFEVDFFWPDLKLVVETDGLRYHRTPSAQARDLKRDQAHTAAGFTRLRFSHWQVKHERDHVNRILGETALRLGLRVP